MSKHSLEDDKGDFWKRMRCGATAAVAVGTGLYALTTAVKKQGLFSNLVDEVKTAMHAAPQLVHHPDAFLKMTDAASKIPAPEDEEKRAVLEMQLRFAMQRQDSQRVQEISRQIDLLGGQAAPTNNRSTDAAMVHTFPGATTVPSAVALSPDARDPSPNIMLGQLVQQSPVPRTTISYTTTTAMPLLNPAELGILASTGNGEMPTATMDVATTTKKDATTPSAQDTNLTKAVPRKSTKQMEPAKRIVEQELTPRQAALLHLQGGDVVEALDPVTCKWSAATVRGWSKNGLVEVLWDDPGQDADGKPFHPIGEVWAEQIRVKRRRPPPPLIATTSAVRVVDDEVVVPPFDLQIGDNCFAMGTVVDSKWFEVKLIGVRAREPPLRVEYLATLDGQTNELLLPSPRKDYVNMDQIQRDKPEEPTELPRERRNVKSEDKIEGTPQGAPQANSQETQVPDDEKDDEVVITPDLMCSVCERPDDEENMLVCDCKQGFHIYCLKPALDKVPEGNWLCPNCATKK